MNRFLEMKNNGEIIFFSDLLKDIPSDDVLNELFPHFREGAKSLITQRGMQVLKLRVEGFTQTQIAEKLNLSPGMVARSSSLIRNGLRMLDIPPYVKIDVPALRRLLRMDIAPPTRCAKLSELLRDMPSDEEIAQMFAEQGNVLGNRIKHRPTHRDLQMMRRRMDGSSYASIGKEFGLHPSDVKHQVTLTLSRLSRDMRIELDVPKLSGVESSQPISRFKQAQVSEEREPRIYLMLTKDEAALLITALKKYEQEILAEHEFQAGSDATEACASAAKAITDLCNKTQTAILKNTI